MRKASSEVLVRGSIDMRKASSEVLVRGSIDIEEG